MTTSADLLIEVLERLAHRGEDRSTSAVWDALERLYELGRVERPRLDRYVLPVAPTPRQLGLEEG